MIGGILAGPFSIKRMPVLRSIEHGGQIGADITLFDRAKVEFVCEAEDGSIKVGKPRAAQRGSDSRRRSGRKILAAGAATLTTALNH